MRMLEKPKTMGDIAAMLNERRLTHGHFSDHAAVTQYLKGVRERFPALWAKLSDTQKEALEMNWHKDGRILAGDPSFADHWADKEGYSRIANYRPPGV